jgi:O-antigen/teichoic acid export membrane protein
MNFLKSPLLKDFLSYGFVGVLGKAINIFVIPLYVKYLSVEEFGILEIFVTATAIFTLISTFQLDSAFLRFYSQLKNKEDIDIYFSTGLNSIVLLLFPLCFIIYFIMKSFFIGINNDVLFAIIILIPVKSLFSYIACIFRVTFNRSLFIKINLINIIGIPILSVVLLSLNNGLH